MRKSTLWKLCFLIALLSPIAVGNLWAQLQNGKVYCFTNKANAGKSLTITNSTNLTIATTSTSDYKQLWYAMETSSGVYALLNLENGKFLNSPNATGNADWTTVASLGESSQFTVTEVETGYYALRAINTTAGDHYMHYGSHTDDIVCWSYVDGATNIAASCWKINEASVAAATLQEKLSASEGFKAVAAQQALKNLFTDNACTEFKKSFASLAALQADADYQNLPSALQAMATKIYNNDWSENNYDGSKSNWDSEYAQKYRVQLYEPYSDKEKAASALGIQAHSYLSNPTGIFANNGETLYVMVEGKIDADATLYLDSYTGNGKPGNSRTSGVQLKEGLNVVNYNSDGQNLLINYVVNTFDTSNGKRGSAAKYRKLSEFPTLKIHIEGGHINGYYNKEGDALYSADNNTTWEYIEARATQTTVTVLGKYMTLQFPLRDRKDGEKGTVIYKGLESYFNEAVNVEATINEWDNVMLWERLLMGLMSEETIKAEAKKSPYSDKPYVFEYTGNDTEFASDYSEYYNTHGLAWGFDTDGYMYGTWDHSGYHLSTMDGVIKDLPTSSGAHWGPGHEIGHQHQQLLNMNGLTEVTNNLFSNVVLWYFGETTSRYNGDEGSLSHVLEQFNTEGADFFSNNIWAQTIMYYKLFLYYHVLGHNPKFYPRLFEMLRQDPMSGGYYQDGSKCLMHFYKKCCDAAGEDLTEFFRAHGFFEVMTDRFVGDYSNSVYNLTQSQIDAAIEEVKDKNYPVNIAVLFINDATGETIQSHKGDNLEKYGETTICAEVGGYATFKEAADPSYAYTISGNTVTMTGEGGVGFALLNDKGEIIGFADKKNFNLSNEAMEQLTNGEITIAAINKAGQPVEAEAGMSEEEMNRSLLAELIKQGEAIKDLTDDTGKKIGFYRSSATTEVEEALATAKTVYDNNETAAYAPVYNNLKEAIDKLKAQDFAKNRMKPGTYILRNYAFNGHMQLLTDSENLNKLYRSSEVDETKLGNTEKWVFEAAEGEDCYYIKSLQTNNYIEVLNNGTSAVASVATKDKGAAFHIESVGNGVFRLICQSGDKKDLHCTNGTWVIGWSDGGGSRWYLTALETEELSAEQQALEELIVQTEEYLEDVAEINKTGDAIALGEENYYTNAKCKNTLYGDQFTSYGVLFDQNANTFLHTDYSGADSDDGLDHYLRVDLGAENAVSVFTFTYQTRTGNTRQNPTVIRVEGSNEANGTYTLIQELTSTGDNLPGGEGQTYLSDLLGSKDKSYRYLRFVVTETISKDNDGKHIFFTMAELGVSKVDVEIAPLAKYASVTDAAYLTQAFDAIRQAKQEYKVGKTSEDFTAAYDKLVTYRNQLKTIAESTESTDLTDKQTELQEWIDKTTELLNDCGTVDMEEATMDGALKLQTKDSANAFYLSTNADQNTLGSTTDGGGLAHLVDGITNSSENYFHSQWDSKNEASKINDLHFLQVDLGDDAKLGEFKFNYVTRNNSNGSPYPTNIVVYASEDGTNFNTTLATLSSGLPSGKGVSYESAAIKCGNQYKSLRFTVAQSAEGNGAHPLFDNVYCFAMSEFGITAIGSPASYTVTVKDNILTTTAVTNEIMLAAWKENQSAIQAKVYATSEEQLDKAIEKLQAEYQSLYNAYNNIGEETLDKSELAALIAATQEMAEECYDGENLAYPNSLYLTETFVTATEQAIANAEAIYNNAGTTSEQLAAAIAALNEAKNNLAYALSHATLPVMVTTDVENPTLYKIRIKRTDTSLLELTSNNYVKVNSTVYAGDKNQTWLFMDNADKDGKVLILPYSKVAVTKTYINLSTDKNASSTSWRNTYSSNAYEGLTFATGPNNMKSQGGVLTIASGLNHPCTWTLTAPSGYLIQSYGFKFYNYDSAASDITLTPTGQSTYTSSKNEQTLTVNNVNAGSTTIVHDGTNEEIVLKDFYVNLVPTESMLVLAANDLNDGADKVTAQAKDSEGYAQDWTITPSEGSGCEGWFYISTTLGDKSNYFSNNGNTTRWMGFWTFGTDKADGGSNFQFVEVDNSDFDKEGYNLLKNYYDYSIKIKSSSIVGGTNPGYYPKAQADAYNDAYNSATSALEAEPSVEADCYAAYAALKAANEDEAFKIQMPEVGTYYVIRSACSKDHRNGQLMYSTKENAMHFSKEHKPENPEAIWTITEEGYLYNLQNGLCVSTVATWGEPHKLGTNPQVVKINSISLDGQLTLTPGNGLSLHAQDNYSVVVGWNTEANDASAWRMEKADLSDVQFPISISKYGYAGLHLNYPVNIPDGVEAYVVKKATGEDGVAILEKIDGGIIPANTGVILKSQAAYDAQAAKDYVLTHASSEGVEPAVSLLDGANYLKYVKAEPNTDYYLFGAKNGVVGLYKAYEQFNISGTTEQASVTEPGGTLNGVLPIIGNTYYLCNKHLQGDVFFSIADGAIAFNKEKKIDDTYRWLCVDNYAITTGAGTQSYETMNNFSEATEIQIRNISGTNRWYFCGNKNQEKPGKETIFLWEPAGDGKFYLKKKYPTNEQGEGYLQTTSPANIGAKATAQKFTAEYKYPVPDEPESSADKTNLVRFVCVESNVGKWINCQQTGGTPVYNSGQGGFTMHNVYLTESTINYAFKNVATNQYFAWQGLSNNAYAWELYDTVQDNYGNGLQAGCVSMKNGDFLVVENASEWDKSTKDGYYNNQFSSSFYFEKFVTQSTKNTNEGGHFQCSANKIYLPYSTVANASKFTFRFDGGVTTDLEEALFGNEEGQQIYDLQGRRVERITAPGLYIVNGQKRYVKAAKF